MSEKITIDDTNHLNKFDKLEQEYIKQLKEDEKKRIKQTKKYNYTWWITYI